jgi:hypothetical protein
MRIQGVNFDAEAERRGSGVWRAFGGFETQRAIKAGRQAEKELRDAQRAVDSHVGRMRGFGLYVGARGLR